MPLSFTAGSLKQKLKRDMWVGQETEKMRSSRKFHYNIGFWSKSQWPLPQKRLLPKSGIMLRKALCKGIMDKESNFCFCFLLPLIYLFHFISFEIWFSYHNTHPFIKCLIISCLIYSQRCATITTIKYPPFQSHSHPLPLQKLHTHWHLSMQPLFYILTVSMCLCTFHINGIMQQPFVAGFFHMYKYIIPFYDRMISHCTDIKFYPFIS